MANELFPIITRETALLIGVGSNAYISPDPNDPNSVEGARIAKGALNGRLEDLGYQDIQRECAMHCATYGTWAHMAWWDVDYTVTTRVPVTGAMRCPSCGFSLASEQIEPQHAAMFPMGALEVRETRSVNALVPAAASYRAVGCARCPGQALAPWLEPPVGERDSVGRPLSEHVPLGDVAVEVVSPYDLFLQDQGIDVNPRNWREIGVAIPKSLDWFRSHFSNGWKVQVDGSDWLWRYHPLIRELGVGAEGSGPEVFSNHALWQVYVRKPTTLKPEGDDELPVSDAGRLVMMGGRTVLLDCDLMQEDPRTGEMFPVFHVDWSPWELRDRSGYGLGMVELAASQQDSLNTGKSQVQDTRHRLSNPKLLAKKGSEFDYQGGAATGYPADIITYANPDPDDASVPTQIGGQLFPQGYWNEHDRDLQGMERTLMVREVEGGFPPKSVDAYSSLVLLLKQAAKGREPRIERIRHMKVRLYKFILKLMEVKYIEERQFRVEVGTEQTLIEKFRGLDLRGYVDVKVTDEPLIDPGLQRRSGITQGIELGTISLDSESARQKVNEALEVPKDINEERNHQVEQAERESRQWLLHGIEPVIDEDGDDHMIHWEIQKLDLSRREWQQPKDRCRWRRAIKAIWGWKERLSELQAAEAQLKAQPPMEPPQELGVAQPEQYQHQLRLYQMQAEAKAKLDALPKPIDLRIMMIWQSMIAEGGGIPELSGDDEGLEALGKVLRLEAHAAGHRLLAQSKTMAAGSGMPEPAAPGGAQTAAGMVPGPGEAATPPPGGGLASSPAQGT